MTYFDPWFTSHIAHRSPDDIARCLRESTAALRAETPQPRPGHDASLDIDPDRPPRGGKSRAAVRDEWRPVTFGPYDEHGVDKHGHYDPAADGRWT